MTPTASPDARLSDDQWSRLDDLVRKIDEDRWLSSRYAGPQMRRRLLALYAFNWELARVRLAVSEPGLAAIRFQWWRDAIDEVMEGESVRAHETLQAMVEADLFGLPLTGLIDGYETALEAGERAAEPEPLLMRIACDLLADTAWAGFDMVARHFAAGRRGLTGCAGDTVARVPSAIRPAVAHGRLRHVYAKTPEPSPFRKRWTILRAVMTGQV